MSDRTICANSRVSPPQRKPYCDLLLCDCDLVEGSSRCFLTFVSRGSNHVIAHAILSKSSEYEGAVDIILLSDQVVHTSYELWIGQFALFDNDHSCILRHWHGRQT